MWIHHSYFFAHINVRSSAHTMCRSSKHFGRFLSIFTSITKTVKGPRLVMIVPEQSIDRKSTRLNSSHVSISYAVFCLKKKKTYDKLIKTIKKTKQAQVRLSVQNV